MFYIIEIQYQPSHLVVEFILLDSLFFYFFIKANLCISSFLYYSTQIVYLYSKFVTIFQFFIDGHFHLFKIYLKFLLLLSLFKKFIIRNKAFIFLFWLIFNWFLNYSL